LQFGTTKHNRARPIPAKCPQAEYSPLPDLALARGPTTLPPPDARRTFLPRQAFQSCAPVETTAMIERDTLQAMTSTRINSHVLGTLRALEPELRAAGVRHVSVFGSVARGEDTATSDVDLAVDLAPDSVPPGFQFVTHIERLKLRLAAALSRDVDIVVLPARRPELRETLSREAIAAF
jgi:predicted nucleotidyltransferase